MQGEEKKDGAAEAEVSSSANGQDKSAGNGQDQAPPEQSEPEVEAAPAKQASTEAEAAAAIDPEARIAELEQEVLKFKDRLLRSIAETDNIRKRDARLLEDAHKYAISNFAKDLLNVSDNLRRAIEAVPGAAAEENELLKNLCAGVQAVERDLLAAFDKNGITKITPLNDRFDPNFHQAMFEVPDSGQPAGTVVQMLQPGYLLQDRLLRPAMVGVAKGAPEEKKVDTTV